MLRKFSIGSRIIAIILVFSVSIAMLLIVIALAGNTMKEQGIDDAISVMMEGQEQRLKLATHSMAQVLGKRLAGVKDPKEQAEAIAAYINDIRFEEDKSGYYFVYRGTTVFVHPVQPALVGKDLNQTADANGVFYVRELNNQAKKGGGFVSFIFGKPKPGGGVENAPKLAYVEMIPGTDLWISTGVYIDNVDKHKTQIEETLSAALARLLYVTLGVVAAAGLFLLLPFTVLTVKSLTVPLKEATATAARIAEGDLDIALAVSGTDEISVLQKSLVTMVEHLRSSMASVHAKEAETIAQAQAAKQAAQAAEEALAKADQATRDMIQVAQQVENAAQEVQANAENISGTTSGMRAGMQAQQAHLHEITEAMERLSASAAEIAASAASAANTSEEARQGVENGAQIAEQTGGAMQQLRDVARNLKENTTSLGKQSESIGQIIGVINDIADQTNLLALNAAIEAARAGDAGRGFAVVADEVRKLAEKTMGATNEVHSSIQAIQGLVQKNSSGMDNAVAAIANVSRLSAETADSLKHVLTLVREGAHQMAFIAKAVEGQSSSSAAVTKLVTNVNSVVERDGVLITAADSEVQALSRKAGELLALVTALR